MKTDKRAHSYAGFCHYNDFHPKNLGKVDSTLRDRRQEPSVKYSQTHFNLRDVTFEEGGGGG